MITNPLSRLAKAIGLRKSSQFPEAYISNSLAYEAISFTKNPDYGSFEFIVDITDCSLQAHGPRLKVRATLFLAVEDQGGGYYGLGSIELKARFSAGDLITFAMLLQSDKQSWMLAYRHFHKQLP